MIMGAECDTLRRGESMITRKLILATLCILLPFVFMGCSGTEEAGITFSAGGAPSELDFWEALVRNFENETGIPVNFLRQPTDTDQRRQGLVISLEAGKSDPDVFLMDVVWIPQLAASGWLEPLDGYAAKSRVDLAVFFPNILRLADTYRDTLVALPVYVDGGLLYYRKDLLDRFGFSGPPETWDQLVEVSLEVQTAMRKINPNFYGFVWQGAQYEGLICNFLEFAGSNGGGVSFEGTDILLNTPENRIASEFMVDLIHRYHVSPPSTFTEMKEEEVRLAFQHGNALFERNWPYAWPLHQSPGSAVRGKTGIAPLPHFPKGQSISILGGWHLGISKHSDRKAESWKLVEFLISRRVQKEMALGLGWSPARRDVYSDPTVLEKMPHFAQLPAVFENTRPRPTLPYYSQLSEVLQRHINSMLAGRSTPETALSSAQREAQMIVDRYRE